MEPFKNTPSLAELTGQYPSAQKIVTAANSGAKAKLAIARQWLSEGIPYAFKDCPGIYEEIRTWLGHYLTVDPKGISVTGSGRLGTSIAPKKLGNPFNEYSDLDFFIISGSLFERLKKDFNKWSLDFENGEVKPKNSRERGFWKDNRERGITLIQKGFLDASKIPNYSQYETAQNINQLIYLLQEKLKVTSAAPIVSGASIRCYSSWDAYIQQVSLSLTQDIHGC